MRKGGEFVVRGLYTSASGMLAGQVALDATANNLANVSTVGFKRDRAVYHDFEDMLLVRLYDSPDGPTPSVPMPVQIVGRLGTGVYAEEVVPDLQAQGPLQQTGRPLDIALQGEGYLVVNTPQGERYTRAGEVQRTADGALVNLDGHPFQGENGDIVIPYGAANADITIAEGGDVAVGESVIDRLRVVTLPPDAQKEGYTLVSASGGVIEGAPGTTVHQGALEQSTVNGVREMVELIQIQRAYEAGQKMIEASDDSLARLFELVAG